MKATGTSSIEDLLASSSDSAAAKRAHVATEQRRGGPVGSWARERLLRERRKVAEARPEIVRVRCGRALHRLRVVDGGSAVLLNHPRLDIKAERAVVALGGQPADCVRMLDAIAGRLSAWSIRGRKRMYYLARTGQDRHGDRLSQRWRAVGRSVAERYAAFVQRRAMRWLDTLLPAGTEFDVRIVPPPGVAVTSGWHPVWSWRRRLGVSQRWRDVLIVHIPIDWHVCVEKMHSNELQTAFVVDARVDRRGQLIQSVYSQEVQLRYMKYIEWTTRIEALDAASPASPRRWQRAARQCRITLPSTA